ncbi:hypothetical protein NM688_g7606 [Phlebia brevispora]|uniref:Uncharacterized protein n=1 Tax=Phlebia brevispora TaxID=194682 RepID=A0ACC1S3B7_9APHY|nr:hypothetical protein NM688_g7606 [Phlebia brevispora]
MPAHRSWPRSTHVIDVDALSAEETYFQRRHAEHSRRRQSSLGSAEAGMSSVVQPIIILDNDEDTTSTRSPHALSLARRGPFLNSDLHRHCPPPTVVNEVPGPSRRNYPPPHASSRRGLFLRSDLHCHRPPPTVINEVHVPSRSNAPPRLLSQRAPRPYRQSPTSSGRAQTAPNDVRNEDAVMEGFRHNLLKPALKKTPWKSSYTHKHSLCPGFTYNFDVSKGSTSSNAIFILDDEEELDAGTLDSLPMLVCACCLDPLVRSTESGDEENKQRKVWALRCGHLLDGKCVGKLMLPGVQAQSTVRQNRGSGVKSTGTVENSVRSRLRSSHQISSLSVAANATLLAKASSLGRCGSQPVATHEFRCPVAGCDRLHRSLLVPGKDWEMDQQEGAVAVSALLEYIAELLQTSQCTWPSLGATCFRSFAPRCRGEMGSGEPEATPGAIRVPLRCKVSRSAVELSNKSQQSMQPRKLHPHMSFPTPSKTACTPSSLMISLLDLASTAPDDSGSAVFRIGSGSETEAASEVASGQQADHLGRITDEPNPFVVSGPPASTPKCAAETDSPFTTVFPRSPLLSPSVFVSTTPSQRTPLTPRRNGLWHDSNAIARSPSTRSPRFWGVSVPSKPSDARTRPQKRRGEVLETAKQSKRIRRMTDDKITIIFSTTHEFNWSLLDLLYYIFRTRDEHGKPVHHKSTQENSVNSVAALLGGRTTTHTLAKILGFIWSDRAGRTKRHTRDAELISTSSEEDATRAECSCERVIWVTRKRGSIRAGAE